jgi:hypothetical protein
MFFSKFSEDFRFFWASAGVALAVLVGIYSFGTRLVRKIFWPLVVVTVAWALTLACVLLPGKLFMHYLLLLVPDTTMFVGLVILTAISQSELIKDSGKRISPGSISWLKFSAVLIVGLQVFRIPVHIYNYKDAFRDPHALSVRPGMSLVAQRVLKVSRPGDTLSVWGWEPKYYLETGLIPATREVHCHRIISPGPLREYFRKRYLDDLRKNPPTVFIDAVADGNFIWHWKLEDNRHESFPELNEFIEKNYTLWDSICLGRPQYPVRIYIAKERATAVP